MTRIHVGFPDGSVRDFSKGVTGRAIAESIAPSLAKKALLIAFKDEVYDLDRPLEEDGDIRILTLKDEETLDVLRHDTAHILAQAVQELYPETQVTIGPVIKDGFYYDFYRETPFSREDFPAIEEKMHEIVARNLSLEREVWDRKQAIDYFTKKGELYKAEIVGDIPSDQAISIYRQGNWLDLCRGPHLPSTGKIGTAFKLMKVAGAYWRGDSNKAQMQRIYGTAWASEKDLKAHLHRLEEAEKRDHRLLGRKMDLFHFQDEARGMPFWHDKGWTLWQMLETYMRRRLRKAGYQEVKTPSLIDRNLWEASGHWDKFGEHMFTSETEDTVYALKPMNCPAHVQIFRQGITSYRDLPLRMAEFGSCHRNEPSGALHGLMRVRGFTQDDAHIFCRETQITQETQAFITFLKSVYRDIGFNQVKILFSDRPSVRAGSDTVWDRAETALQEAMHASGLDVKTNPGEGAFYGPKLEFVLEDALGRSWQCGTLQVDFVLPERLDATYIDERGERQRPVMLHRAVLGSMERFIGVLIEHYAGILPLWLAPQQMVVASVTSDANPYAEQVATTLNAAGLRVETDLRNEKISYKIREHSHAKIPLIAVVGQKEADNNTLALRRLGSKQQEILDLQTALTQFVKEGLPPDLREKS